MKSGNDAKGSLRLFSLCRGRVFLIRYGMEQPPAMPPTHPSAPAKKGMPALAWVGIGCGGLILVAIVAAILLFKAGADKIKEFAANPEKAGAEMIVSMNPDLEMVSQDEGKGEMTIRTKDGKEMTLSYKDIAEGKLVMTDAEGNETVIGSGDLSKVPAWVPKAPDLSEAVSTFHSNAGGQVSGQFSGKSGQSADDLKTFFADAASGLGMTSSSTGSTSLNGTTVSTMEYSGGGKSLTIVITETPGSRTLVNTNYTEK